MTLKGKRSSIDYELRQVLACAVAEGGRGSLLLLEASKRPKATPQLTPTVRASVICSAVLSMMTPSSACLVSIHAYVHGVDVGCAEIHVLVHGLIQLSMRI